MSAILVVIGFLILVTGHQSGWLYVGGVAFMSGGLLADQLSIAHTELEMIIFSLTSGALGALLVAYLRRIMVTIAGFISGGYVLYYLPAALGWDTGWINWILVALAGIASAILIFLWGPLPLILISTLLGATLIVQHLTFGSLGATGMFIVLSIFGLIAQWILWQYSKPDNE